MNKLTFLTAFFFLSFSLNSFAQQEDASKAEATKTETNKAEPNKTEIVKTEVKTKYPSKIGVSGFADIIEPLLPAVVNVSTSQKVERKDGNTDQASGDAPEDFLFDNFRDLLEDQKSLREISSLGSGFIISKDGYIVTNQHVIDKADTITVNLTDSRSFKARIIGIDKKTDLALLKINPKEELAYVKMGDSGNSRIGEWVIAVGNPFGLGGSVSVGIISANGRNINSGKFDDYIQTDAAINKGNSGGPLFNIKGEVIGIATAIFSPSGGSVGIGFATPTSIAGPVIEQLKNSGEVTRGWLGVSIQDVSQEMAEAIGMSKPRGAFVVEVTKDSPADKAGIVATDIITKFDEILIQEMKDLPKAVSATPINKSVEIQLIRQGKVKVLKTKIQKLDDEKIKLAAEQDSDNLGKSKVVGTLLGMGLADLTKQVKEENKLKESTVGVLIVDVKKDSIASKNGIEKGDIILSANQIPVSSIANLKKIAKKLEKNGKDSIFLFIKREKLIKTNNFIQQRSSTFAVILPLK